MKNNEIIEVIKNTYGSLAFTKGSSGYEASQSWVVENFFPSFSFGVLYGKPGARKSFLAIDISCAIATGKKWHGYNVSHGAVVYIAAEGQMGIARRVKAWEQVNGVSVHNLYILGESVFVSEDMAQKHLIEAIQEIEEKDGVKVQLIVFDTLARNFIGNENNSDSMGDFVRGCDNLRQSTKSSVLCIHHSGKDARSGARGSNSLLCACDFEFQVIHNNQTQLTTLQTTKQKDSEPMPDLNMQFTSITLDQSGHERKPITSLVLTAPPSFKKEINSTDNPLLRALKSYGSEGCTRAELRKHFPTEEGLSSNAMNQRFKRSLNALVESGLITIHQKGDNASSNDLVKPKEYGSSHH
ncbi:helicase RepA family protein [Vibrio vulnificus]|uniref:helicase RepA family protein n=1 Tax=Vibrio vulnificus TaxID=672 RepID=UPI003D9CA854